MLTGLRRSPAVALLVAVSGALVVCPTVLWIELGCSSPQARPAPQPSAQRNPCRVVGRADDPSSFPRLYQENGSVALILAGNDVLVCGCEGRSLGGGVENRALAGATENRNLGGATENRALAGATENRNLGGATENRALGGATENRALAGATENRALGGATEQLTCSDAPPCRGYGISGVLPIRIYDAAGLRPLPSRCVE